MSTKLSFPPGVWGLILHIFCNSRSQDELTHIWIILRLVYREFKVAIEDIFSREHLTKTWLHNDAVRLLLFNIRQKIYEAVCLCL